MQALKEPAFMMFPSEFIIETFCMSNEEIGIYIKIICNMHFHGHLSKDKMRIICGGEIPESIIEKLEVDENGEYYHNRLEYEIEKRSNYVASRRKNANSKKQTADEPIENPEAENPKVYGIYKNVMLTDGEYEDLKERFKTGLNARIDELSKYIKMKGVKYSSHYAVIIEWDAKNKSKLAEEQSKQDSTFDVDDFFEAALERSRNMYKSSVQKNDSG